MSNIKVSIIVPVYNAEKYLEQCLNSLMNQTLQEIEIICVNDGSTDNSLEILRKYASKDSRINIIDQVNNGPGISRNIALDNSSGQYIMFCDSDDWYELNMVETMFHTIIDKEVDVVVCKSNFISDTKTENFNWINNFPNKVSNTITLDEVLKINSLLWNKIYKKSTIVQYNIRMPHCEHDDDFFNYQYFLVSNTIFYIKQALYNYNLSNENSISTNISKNTPKNKEGRRIGILYLFKFLEYNLKFAENKYKIIFIAICDYQLLFLNYSLFSGNELQEIINNLNNTFSKYSFPKFALINNKITFVKVSIIVPVYNTARYLEQCLNSLTNQTLQEIEIICVNDGSSDNSLDILNKLANKNQKIKVINQANGGPSKARNIGIDNAIGQYIGFCDSDDFVDLDYYQVLYNYAIGNQAEMASAYVFVNSKDRNEYGSWLSFEVVNKIELASNNEKIGLLYKNHNVTVYKHIYSRELINKKNIRFNLALHGPEDQLFTLHAFYYTNKIAQIPLNLSPKYYHQFDRGNLSTVEKSTNQEKRIFDQLLAIDKSLEFLSGQIEDKTFYSLFLTLKLIGDENINNCDIVFKAKMEKIWNEIIQKNKPFIKPIKPINKENRISLVFSADNEYAPYLGVTIKSLIKNSTPGNNYDIIIICDNITEHNKQRLQSLEENNIFIRFVDITMYLLNINLSTFHLDSHFALPTYYRFFISSIFTNYDKILYLDCDIIIEDDIAKLFHYDINNCMLGAAIDIEAQRKRNTDYLFNDYCSSKLGIKNSPYFQAGVLLFNIKQSIEQNIQNKCLEKLKTFKPKYVDQCVLNFVCKEQVFFFPTEWNFEWHIPFEDKNYKNNLTASEYEEYSKAKNNIKIIHYSSHIKPWQYPHYELADRWWHYARQSPFYEEILFKNISKIESTKSNDTQASSTETSKLKYYKISQVFPFLRIVQQDNTKKFMLWRFIPVRKVVFDANKVHKYLFCIKYKTVETAQSITSNDNYVKTYSLAQTFPFLRIVEENNTRKFMLWRFIPIRKVVFDGNKVHKYLFGIKYRTVSR